MTGTELLIFFLVLKKRIHSLYLCIHLDSVTEHIDKLRDRFFLRIFRAVKTGAYGSKKMAVFRLDNFVTLEIQSTYKCFS